MIGALNFAFSLAAALLIGLCFAPRAQADETIYAWIHAHAPHCCDHRDCKPAAATWTPEGWRVEGVARPVPERATIRWPFAATYACIWGGRLRCLFVNAGG
jgi:hypothetical protein